MNEDYFKPIQEQAIEQQKIQQQVQQLESVMRQYLSREAWSRYTTLRTAHPDKAITALAIVAQLAQKGLPHPLTDIEFKEVLVRLAAKANRAM